MTRISVLYQPRALLLQNSAVWNHADESYLTIPLYVLVASAMSHNFVRTIDYHSVINFSFPLVRGRLVIVIRYCLSSRSISLIRKKKDLIFLSRYITFVLDCTSFHIHVLALQCLSKTRVSLDVPMSLRICCDQLFCRRIFKGKIIAPYCSSVYLNLQIRKAWQLNIVENIVDRIKRW